MDNMKISLKPRIGFAIRRLELQKQKLEQATDRFTQRDKAIFARIIDAKTKHDKGREKVFSEELKEIRKMMKTIITSRLKIEQAILRLQEVVPDSDVKEDRQQNVIRLTETVMVLKTVRANLVYIFPEAETEIGEIGNGLSGVMVELGQSSGVTLNFDDVVKRTAEITNEANAKAEQQMKDKYPEIPPPT